MDRSKRNIRTPKRFDDEAFTTPQKPQQQQKHVEPTPKASPDQVPTQSKSIIKVKLSKAKPRDIILKPKESTPKPVEATPKAKELIPKVEESAQKVIEPVIKPKDLTPKTKESTPKLKEPKEPPKAKEASKPNETVKDIKPTREYIKRKESTSKEVIKVKEQAKVDIKTPERDAPIVYRPRAKRPRTPPVYTDVIPNLVLPFWDARTAAEEHEDDNVKELVHCHCGVPEELGLMVQCETCLTWQHAHCLGIENPEDAPDGYTCRACADPKFARESMKWAYDQDWLTKGRMKQFVCDRRPIPQETISTLARINELIGHVLNVHKIIHSLRIKTRLLLNASDDDQELKLFRVQWITSYVHLDGTHFISTINNPSSTPASTISAIGDTPDPGDITVETVAESNLPDIGHLEDVSSILETPQLPEPPIQPMVSNNDATPDECRANLRLHIQQTEEFIGLELSMIEDMLTNLEKDCTPSKNLEFSLDSLKNDLQTMKRYLGLSR